MMTIIDKEQDRINRMLKERPFRKRQFDQKLQQQVLQAISEPKRRTKRTRGWLAPVMLALICVAGIGLLASPLNLGKGPQQPGTITAPPSTSPEVTPTPTVNEQDNEQTLAQTDNGQYRLYVDPRAETDGHYTEIAIARGDEQVYKFDGTLYTGNSDFAPSLQLADLNGDGSDELVVLWGYPLANGIWTQDAHVLNTTDWSEIPMTPIQMLLHHNVDYQFIPLDDYVWVSLDVNGSRYDKALDKTFVQDELSLSSIQYALRYVLNKDPDKLVVSADAYIGDGTNLVSFGNFNIMLQYNGEQMDMEFINTFVLTEDAAGAIPFYAMSVDDTLIPLWVKEHEADLVKLLGDPINEAVKRLGEDGEDAGPFAGTYVKDLTYDGLELKLASGGGEEYRIIGMRISSSKYATSLGIKVGDTAEQVEAAYPFIEVALDGRTPPGNYAYSISEGLPRGLLIEMKNNKVAELYFEYLMD
ncbi:hypothetical protein [Paenibacillus sp. GXUN7292]|uniref:hypothetical protein n=1 Tax=Paenibacillus sp. GXUN7292 TaxID=3422499 RepID=UPI003D7D107A